MWKSWVCFPPTKLCSLFWVEQDDGVLIDFNITNEDIAGFVGSQPETVYNRILNELKRGERFRYSTAKIVILDTESIEELIEGKHSNMATEAQIRKEKEENYKKFCRGNR